MFSPFAGIFMRKNLEIFIFTLVLLLTAQNLVHSQESRSKSLQENLLITAVARFNEGDFNGANGILAKVTSEDPSNDAAWYYLALTELDKKDISKAEDCFRKAVELDPQNFWYRYRLARLYSLTQRQELTIDMYEKLLDDFPKKSDLYFELVELYAAQGAYDKSLETISEIEKVLGMTESLALYRFNLLRALNRQEEAYKSLEAYNDEYSSVIVLTTLADYEMSMYNDSTAIAYYDEALDLAPEYSPALLGKAEALRMTRRYDEYFEALNRFVAESDAQVSEKSEYLMAVVQRTDPKFIRSFMPQLDTVIDRTLSMHPTDSTMLQTAAVYYYSTDRKNQSKDLFRKGVETWPESFAAYANFVEFLMYAQEWEELSAEGRKAFERFPDETAFLEMASVGDYNLKEYDKVLQICNKVIEVAPKDSSATLRAWSTMGDIYHTLGENKKAYKAYDKALKVNPDYVYVLNNYAYYLSMEGKDLKKAYNMSSKTIEAEPDNATYLDTFAWILYLQGKALEAKPFFKHAMLYGGKDSAVILDHYAEVLYALKEYDMAFVYWNMARQKNKDNNIPDLDQRIEERRKAINR